MTILTNNNYVRQLARGLNGIDSTTGSNNKFIIFKGTMPSNLTNWVEADNSSDKLAEFSGFVFGQSGARVIITSIPDPVNATATGTAAWFAWYRSDSVIKYFFGDVTAIAGTGALHLDSVSLTSGNPVTFSNFGVEFTTS